MSDCDKEKLQERLAKLSGGVSVIKIGGSALLCSSFNIKIKGANEDQEAGINIVRHAFHSPARQIATNAGTEAAKRDSGGGGMGGMDF